MRQFERYYYFTTTLRVYFPKKAFTFRPSITHKSGINYVIKNGKKWKEFLFSYGIKMPLHVYLIK